MNLINRLRPHLIPMLLLLAATFVIYARSLGHDFIFTWDDDKYVTANEAVRGVTPEHLKAAFSNYYLGNYAPLHIISYMLDYSLWGMRAAGFIFTNILLHSMNGLLFYRLLIKLTGRRVWAFLASFIFLLHPVQVESVAWISQRKNVLAMAFFLLSFLFYIGYREAGPGMRGTEKATQNSKFTILNSKFLYAGSIAAFVAALLAKSVALILPLALVLYDLCFLEREKRKGRFADKVPYIVAAAVVAYVAMKSQSPELGGGRTGYHGGSPLATFLTMLPVFARYLGMLFWPTGLSAVYNPPIRTGVDATVALSALLLALVFAVGVYLYRRRKDLFFWGILFFIGLLPVSQIVPLVTLMNDRYLYFPMLGGAALIAGAAVSGVDAVSGTKRKAAAAVLCLALLCFPFLSFKRIEVWQNSLALWADACKKTPDSAVACFSLGASYNKIGKLDAALFYYQRALSISPLDRESLQNIGILYLQTGELDKALPYLLRLVGNYPGHARGFRSLGDYYFMTGDLDQAEAAYSRALTLEPRSGAALSLLGNVYFAMRKMEPAREYYRQAMMAGYETPELYYNMACLEAISGRSGEALHFLEAALKLGFKKVDIISQDRKLDSLRTLPEFGLILGKYVSR